MSITLIVWLCVAPPGPAMVQHEDLRFQVDIPIGVHEAFGMWADSARAREFLALEVHIDPWVGGRYEAVFDPENDPAGALAGTYGSKVLELEPPTRLVFQWHSLTPAAAAAEIGGLRVRQESTVEVTCEPLGDNETRIRIRHYGFGSEPHWVAARRFYRDRGWPWIIQRLAALYNDGSRQ